MLGLTLATLLAAPSLACGGPKLPPGQPPDPVAVIDELLPKAKLSQADLDQVRALQSQARALVAAKQHDEAQRVIVRAERIMGFIRPNCAPKIFPNRPTS
jgi:hypothetical protein